MLRTMTKRVFTRGFTLIELMIVIGIIALLIALAIPSYTRYVWKANRGEAQQLLLNWANNQEIWRANDTDYATTGELPAPTHDHFAFTLPTRTATTYTLTATANAGSDQENDSEEGQSCSVLTLDQSNVKTPTQCW